MKVPIAPPDLWLHCDDADQVLGERVAMAFVKVLDALPSYVPAPLRRAWAHRPPGILVATEDKGREWLAGVSVKQPRFVVPIDVAAGEPRELVASVASILSWMYVASTALRALPPAQRERRRRAILEAAGLVAAE